MSQLKRVSDNILRLKPEEQVVFARAFRDSYEWDVDVDTIPNDTGFIAHHSQQPAIVLHAMGILLDRESAHFYLVEDLHAPLGRAAFDKKLTSQAFRNEMGRAISRFSRKHVFTFAEIRKFFEFLGPVEIPAAVREVLKSGKK